MGKTMVIYSPYARTWYSCRCFFERLLVLCPLFVGPICFYTATLRMHSCKPGLVKGYEMLPADRIATYGENYCFSGASVLFTNQAVRICFSGGLEAARGMHTNASGFVAAVEKCEAYREQPFATVFPA